MASGGTLELADGGSVYDNLVKRVAASLPDEGYAEGGGVDWNSYAQTYQQMMDPTYSGSTGLTYTQPLGAPQVTDNAIASGLSSFTPGSAGDGGARSGAAPNDTQNVSAASLGISPANLGMGLGTIASLATGVPGLGLVGSALGTMSEVSEINEALNSTGAQPLGWGQTLSAIGNNLSFGLAGTPAEHSMIDNTSAMVDAARASGTGGYSPEGGYGGPAGSFGGGYGGDPVSAGQGGGWGTE
jgi:hypothetical protein